MGQGAGWRWSDNAGTKEMGQGKFKGDARMDSGVRGRKGWWLPSGLVKLERVKQSVQNGKSFKVGFNQHHVLRTRKSFLQTPFVLDLKANHQMSIAMRTIHKKKTPRSKESEFGYPTCDTTVSLKRSKCTIS